MKKILLAVLLAAFLLSGCTTAPADSRAIQKLDYSFYTCEGKLYRVEDGRLIRSNPALTEKVTLAQPCDAILDIDGDTVWYLADQDLYALPLDGSQPRLLAKEPPIKTQYFTRDWIYSTDYERGTAVRISKQDGSVHNIADRYVEITGVSKDSVFFYTRESLSFLPDNQIDPLPVLDGESFMVSVWGNDAYIAAEGHYQYNHLMDRYDYKKGELGQGCIFRYDIETKSLKKLADTYYTAFVYATSKGLFFQDSTEGLGLRFLPLGSTKSRILTTERVSIMNQKHNPNGEKLHLQDNWLYCLTLHPEYELIRVNIHSGAVEQLSTTMGSVWFEDDKIYYRLMDYIGSGDLYTAYQRPQVYRMNLDGSGVTLLLDYGARRSVHTYLCYPYLYSIGSSANDIRVPLPPPESNENHPKGGTDYEKERHPPPHRPVDSYPAERLHSTCRGGAIRRFPAAGPAGGMGLGHQRDPARQLGPGVRMVCGPN